MNFDFKKIERCLDILTVLYILASIGFFSFVVWLICVGLEVTKR